MAPRLPLIMIAGSVPGWRASIRPVLAQSQAKSAIILLLSAEVPHATGIPAVANPASTRAAVPASIHVRSALYASRVK